MLETNRTGRQARTDTDASRTQKSPEFSDFPSVFPDSGEVPQSLRSDSDNQRIMTDGGHDLIDPRHLPRSWSPATIHVEDGSTFVADARIRDHGWLYVKTWSGERRHYPPHAIERVDYADVERTSKNNTATKGLVDDTALTTARRLAKPTEVDSGQEAIADD